MYSGLTKILFLVIVSAISSNAASYDLGEFGDSYGISEDSLVKRMASEAASIDKKEIAEEKSKEAEKYITDAPRSVNLAVAKENKKIPVEHRLVVESDFYVPVLVDKQTGSVVKAPSDSSDSYRRGKRKIASKGDTINPLDRPGSVPPSDYLVFNPDIKSQKRFALEAASQPNLTLIATHGNIKKLSKKSGTPVYLLMPSMSKIYQIQKTPSFLTSGKYQSKKVLVVAEIGMKSVGEGDHPRHVFDRVINSEWSDLRLEETRINPKKQMKNLGAPDALIQ